MDDKNKLSLSQSPQIGASLQIKSSRRKALVTWLVSQSPQIGASLQMYYGIQMIWTRIKSQSPQIGASLQMELCYLP